MYNRQIKIILFTWSMNMLIVTLVGFFPTKFQTFLNLRGLINILVILYLFKDIGKINIISKAILLFVIYLFILTLFSSNVRLSLVMTIKSSIGMITFLVGYKFFQEFKNFNKLLHFYSYLFVILLFSIIFSNLTGLGVSGYSGEDMENSVSFGGLGVNMTKLLGIPILLAPVFLYNVKLRWQKQLIIFLIFAAIILSIISGKRSSAMGLISGGLIWVLFMNKRKVFLPFIYLVAIALLSFPLYQSFVLKSYEVRKSQLYFVSDEAGSMEREGRYWETQDVINALKNDDIFHKIFGSELFNEFDYFNVKRMLHIDYNVILNGAGILGLFMFLSIYYYTIKKALYFRRIARTEYLKLVSISVIALIVFAMAIAIGGSIRSFDFTGPIYLFTGAALGFVKKELQRENLLSRNYV